jgi:hypothetical protein
MKGMPDDSIHLQNMRMLHLAQLKNIENEKQRRKHFDLSFLDRLLLPKNRPGYLQISQVPCYHFRILDINSAKGEF